MTQMRMLIGLAAAFCICVSADAKPQHVIFTAKQQAEAIAHVKHDWHATTGESAEEIIGSAAKVAHFIPRRWDADKMDDGRIAVSIGWVKHKQDKSGDEYSMSWVIASDGSIEVTPPYAKTLALGSAAFNVSLLQDEVNEGVAGANTSYLRDPRNYNFVDTPNGKLGDLLSANRCGIQNPSYLFYQPDLDGRKQDEAFFLKLIVNRRRVNCALQDAFADLIDRMPLNALRASTAFTARTSDVMASFAWPAWSPEATPAASVSRS